MKRRKQIQALLWALSIALALIATEPAWQQSPAIRESVATLLPGSKAPMLEEGAPNRLGILEDLDAEWLEDAGTVSKEVLTDLMVTQPQRFKVVVEHFKEGVSLPVLDSVQLRIDNKQVMLEYKF